MVVDAQCGLVGELLLEAAERHYEAHLDCQVCSSAAGELIFRISASMPLVYAIF